ncbi:MAG: hypothetical protein KGO02_02630 [Alphaproteobacteria bacterium]|nr:hypothetical protein [Alphaproteobacteria bacterium]
MNSTPEADRLRAVVGMWEGVQDRLQPSVNVSGGAIETASIGESMDRVADMVELSETSKIDQVLKSVHWPNITSQIGNLQNYIQQIVNQGASHQAFQNQAQNIVNTIWSLRSTLVWLFPYSPTERSDTQNPRLAEIIASAEKVLDLRRQSGIAEHALQNTLNEVTQNSERAKALTTEIEGFQRTAENARSNAEANSTATKQAADALEMLLTKQTERSDVLTKLLEEFEGKRREVDETLEGASKVALAKSFYDHRIALNRERWGWVCGFGVGIAVLALVGAFVIPAALADTTHQGPSKYLEAITHCLLLAPIVWATWFAARKAGQTMRLAEDYAFKEAAAHSFVGYKREMGDDADMLHLLRQYAIRNFGADPLRVLSDDEAASPLHYVFDKLLQRIDKLKPEEAAKAIGELARSIGLAK